MLSNNNTGKPHRIPVNKSDRIRKNAMKILIERQILPITSNEWRHLQNKSHIKDLTYILKIKRYFRKSCTFLTLAWYQKTPEKLKVSM